MGSETKEFCTDGPTIPIEVAPTDAPTNAPTNTPTNAPTNAPTANPTKAPTASPTNAPVVAPTNAPISQDCKDKTGKFQYFNGQGKKLKKKCKWVAKKSSSRCGIVTTTGGLVSDFCPK